MKTILIAGEQGTSPRAFTSNQPKTLSENRHVEQNVSAGELNHR